MTRQEFIEKMNEYNYTDRQIKSFLKLINEMKKDGMELSYEEVALERREDDAVVETLESHANESVTVGTVGIGTYEALSFL